MGSLCPTSFCILQPKQATGWLRAPTPPGAGPRRALCPSAAVGRAPLLQVPPRGLGLRPGVLSGVRTRVPVGNGPGRCHARLPLPWGGHGQRGGGAVSSAPAAHCPDGGAGAAWSARHPELSGAARPRRRAGCDAGSLCRPGSLAPPSEGSQERRVRLTPCLSQQGSPAQAAFAGPASPGRPAEFPLFPSAVEPQLDVQKGLGFAGKQEGGGAAGGGHTWLGPPGPPACPPKSGCGRGPGGSAASRTYGPTLPFSRRSPGCLGTAVAVTGSR